MRTAYLSLGLLAEANSMLPMNWPQRFSCTRRVEADGKNITNLWNMDFAAGNFQLTKPAGPISDYMFLGNSTQYTIGKDSTCTAQGAPSIPPVVAVPSSAVWNTTATVDGEVCDVFVSSATRQQSKYAVSQATGHLVSIEQLEHTGRYTVNHFSGYSTAPVPIALPAMCTTTAPAFPAAAAAALGCDGAGNCCGPWDTTCCASAACPHSESHTGGTCC